MNVRITSLLLITGLALAGCDPDESNELQEIPKDAASRTEHINGLIGQHIDGLASALKAVDKSALLSGLLSSEEDDGEGYEDFENNPPAPPPGSGNEGEQGDSEEGFEGSGEEFDLSENTQAIKDWLAEKVFSEDNVENNDDDIITYRIPVEVICVSDDDDNDEEAAGEPDPKCVEVATKYPVRLSVAFVGGSDLEIAVQVGDFKPGSVEIQTEYVAALVNLADSKDMITAISQEFDEEEELNLPKLSGVVKLSLNKNDQADYTLAVGVEEALEVAFEDSDSPEHLSLSLAPAPEAFTLRLSDAHNLVEASLALKQANAAVALNVLEGPGQDCEWIEELEYEECVERDTPREGVLSLALAGLSGKLMLDTESDNLSVTGLGLNKQPAVVKFNDTEILSVDLSALLDLSVAFADGATTLSSSNATLSVTHSLTAFIDALGEDGEDYPNWLHDGFTSLTAEGGLELVQTDSEYLEDCEGEEDECSIPGKLQITRGTLSLSSAETATLVAEAPACIQEIEEQEGIEDEDAHPFASLEVVACN